MATKYLIFRGILLFPEDIFPLLVSGIGSGSKGGCNSVVLKIIGIDVVKSDVVRSLLTLVVVMAVVRVF